MMKFTCDKSSLAREISLAQEIIASKNALSIMSNVYLEAKDSTLVIRATDIKVSFETTIPVSDVVPGALTVFCDKLSTILSSLPDGDILVEQDENKVVLRPVSKRVRFQLKTISGEKFPELARTKDETFFDIPSRDFKRMIAQTIFSVSTDETRYFMNGIFMEKNESGALVMVSTDGRRLAVIKKDIDQGLGDFSPVIIPPKILTVLFKHISDEGIISIAINDKNIFFKFGAYFLASILIEGHFPAYQKVIPQKQKNVFFVKKEELLEALHRVSVFIEQKSQRVLFSVMNGTLTITSEESDIGTAREELSCDYDGEDTSIALSNKYIEDPVRVLESATLAIEFSDPSRAITIRPEPASDYFHVVMPMQSN
jgi:DNA polymerase-3 subunit beta